MDKKNSERETTAEIVRQAAVLWVLLKDGRRLSLDDAWRFLLWLMRSRQHVDEFLFIRRQDARLTRIFRAQRERSKVIHVSWWQGSSAKPDKPRRRRLSAGWSVAAMVFLMLSTVFLLTRRDNDTREGTVAIAAHESKARRLPDGSLVSLDPGSIMHVEFTDKRRDVHLPQGRALFETARDRKRPFIVNTPLVDITSVVESNFAVKIDTSVEVAVYKGVVEVSGRGARPGTPVIKVKSGETYRVPVDRFRAVVAGSGDDLKRVLIDG